MIKTVLTWYRPLERKPPLGRDLFCCMPKDPRPVQIGYTWDGAVWHERDGLPFNRQVTLWAEIPTTLQPKKGKR